MTASPLEILAGLLLVFALPGYAITRATFPEWRVRGTEALLRAVEIGTLSLVLSVTVTILVGFTLGALPGSDFQAAWSNPLLEAVLAAITGVALGTAAVRGAFRRAPPPAPPTEEIRGEDAPFDLLRALEADRRQARRLRHSLRQMRPDDPQRTVLEEELGAIERRSKEHLAAREAEYAR